MSGTGARPGGTEGLEIGLGGSLREAMRLLKASGRGLLCVTDEAAAVIGVLSDGDIRNALLEHGNLDAPVVNHMTRQFTSARLGATKEQVLKLLDGRVKLVPILDEARRLVMLAGSGYNYLPGVAIARAKAPARISLAGGGTDFTDYFVQHGGVSLSATIAKHAHVAIRKRSDGRVIIHSTEQDYRLECASVKDLAYGTPVDLITAAIKVMRPEFGLEVHVSCDYSPGSGLGGSAALLAAMIGCLNEFREERFDSYSIAEHAFDAERIELGFPGGWQDQYATVFGGFNFIEFDNTLNSVTPLRLRGSTLDELEERFLLCHTGRRHLGGAIQRGNASRGSDARTIAFADRVKEIALSMRVDLLRGRLDDFGRMLHETWLLKRELVPESSSPDIDAIYDAALAAGADGGRLLGTGGGGYFLFCVRPFERHKVWKVLEDRGLDVESVVLDHVGMKSWTVRV